MCECLEECSQSKETFFASTNDLFCSILGLDINVKKNAESYVKMSSSIGEAGSFACYHCDKVFSFKYSRERHVICDHEDEDKSFERCLTKFSSMFDLKQYSKLCDKPLKCHKLKKHLKGHSFCQ